MWQKLYILFPFILFFYSSKIVEALSSEEFTVIADKNSVESECLSAKLFNENFNNLQNFIQKEMFRIEKNIIEKYSFESEKINNNIKQNKIQLLDIERHLKKKIEDLSIKQHIIYKIIVSNSAKISALENSTKENYNNVNVKAIKTATNINSEILANINNTTLEIVESLNRVINVSCDTSSTLQNVANNGNTIGNSTNLIQNLNNPNDAEIVQVTTSTEMPSKKSQETEWDWSRCREETVPNRDVSSVQLHPLSAAGGGGRLRLAVRGDNYMYIYLSQEERLHGSRGLYFVIEICRAYAHLYVVNAGAGTRIQYVSVDTGLSSSRWTRVALDVGAGSLEVRVGDAATPLLTARDPRLDQVGYLGFNTCCNPSGYGTFKYGC